MNKSSLHYIYLTGIILVAAILRFLNLELKPLWMDEVITSIFSLGNSYRDLPLDFVFPLVKLPEIFTYQPETTCLQIAENLASQSTHPALFFCAMHGWLGWLNPLGASWIFNMRSLPAILGICTVPVVYYLNRIAFNPQAGIIAAALMAVSPFAVYLSQEARHYTLPMLLICYAIAFLLKLQHNILRQGKIQIGTWFTWVIINILGLYVHYFFILAFISQVATLIIFIFWQRKSIYHLQKYILFLIGSVSLVILAFIPWMTILLTHSRRTETDWLRTPENIAPVYQTLISWILMVVSFPVENQPLFIKVISGVLMLLFSIWVGFQFFSGLKLLLINPQTKFPAFTLLIFTLGVLLEFFIIIYTFQKDITIVPRYSFVYYSSFCALIAGSLLIKHQKKYFPWVIILVGLISCLCVVSNLSFQKPFDPSFIATKISQEPEKPHLLVVSYRDYQDVALGLSFAVSWKEITEKKVNRSFIDVPKNMLFISQNPDFQVVWQKLAALPEFSTTKLNFWIVGSGLRQRDFPAKIKFAQTQTCFQDNQQYYRRGVPLQLYRCDIPELAQKL
ncbi:glycosyltransferase family 39 protein [Calothrix sp. PCC 6303]|uniref:glycosyltransferase family 39 protein n=1 Tax=Calothrix sp. PCC 6303 TaxID=1170562 RepID=UPI0002A02DB5|nr:glycosyltransferase family 39 protein [Calothrix sp. PCC 6303]AFY99712.1 hypothetical protein Cal6303_0641 [Calothrix sp. PCC 6303]